MSTRLPRTRAANSTASPTGSPQAQVSSTNAALDTPPPPPYTDRMVTLSEIGDLLRPLLQRLDEQAAQIQQLTERIEQREQQGLQWPNRLLAQLRDRLRFWLQVLNRLLLALRERIRFANVWRQVEFYGNLLDNHPEVLARVLASEESLVQWDLTPLARLMLLRMALQRVRETREEPQS